jgi:arginine-tRNA-protein transferase
MDFTDYRAMVEDTPVDTNIVEFREPDGRLAAVSLSDRLSDGLSGVYKFFALDRSRSSPGTYVILWHIEQARDLGLPYVYLGYWIAESPKMAYKTRFQPLEGLVAEQWVRLTGDERSSEEMQR